MSEALARLHLEEHKRTLKARDRGGESVLEAARRVISFKTLKVVSLEWERPEASISHQYRGEKGSYARLTDAPDLIRWAPDDEFARVLVGPRYHVQRAPEVTTEESLIGLLTVIAKYFGPKVTEPLLAEAHREALAEAAKRRGGQ